jgi:putative Ca2+/H+ antiporter (TMEM165/GDT1 family)
VSPYIALITFPVIFLGELPDKTMFASLVMATDGRPKYVWLGAAAAFVVHVAIAVSIGVAIFSLFPRRGVDAAVAALFAAGAVYAWREASKGEEAGAAIRGRTDRQVVLTAFVVIFLAEWGDLTQILTANLAARYHSPISVGVGALLALWAVSAIAVAGGQSLLRYLKVSTIRKVTAVVLLALAAYSAWTAVR